jgi:hypothetical protein
VDSKYRSDIEEASDYCGPRVKFGKEDNELKAGVVEFDTASLGLIGQPQLSFMTFYIINFEVPSNETAEIQLIGVNGDNQPTGDINATGDLSLTVAKDAIENKGLINQVIGTKKMKDFAGFRTHDRFEIDGSKLTNFKKVRFYLRVKDAVVNNGSYIGICDIELHYNTCQCRIEEPTNAYAIGSEGKGALGYKNSLENRYAAIGQQTNLVGYGSGPVTREQYEELKSKTDELISSGKYTPPDSITPYTTRSQVFQQVFGVSKNDFLQWIGNGAAALEELRRVITEGLSNKTIEATQLSGQTFIKSYTSAFPPDYQDCWIQTLNSNISPVVGNISLKGMSWRGLNSSYFERYDGFLSRSQQTRHLDFTGTSRSRLILDCLTISYTAGYLINTEADVEKGGGVPVDIYFVKGATSESINYWSHGPLDYLIGTLEWTSPIGPGANVLASTTNLNAGNIPFDFNSDSPTFVISFNSNGDETIPADPQVPPNYLDTKSSFRGLQSAGTGGLRLLFGYKVKEEATPYLATNPGIA